MKIAWSTICSDGYVEFLKHYIKSILFHNPDFNYDFFVFCDGRLEKGHRDFLLTIYPKFIFKDVDNLLYEQNHKGSLKFYSFESFTLDYDKVIFTDCDLICLKPYTELMQFVSAFARLGMAREKRRGDSMPFNAGFLIIDKSFLTEENYRGLLSADYSGIPVGLNDQKSYNCFFKNKITELPQRFNTLVSEVEFISFKEIVNLHYIYKPNTEENVCKLDALNSGICQEYKKYD